MHLRPLTFLILFIVSNTLLMSQADPQAYRLFDQKGKKVKYKKMVRALQEADVILFGESHNDPIAHWLQHEVARSLRAAGPLVLGMEMFESDQQAALNAYLAGETEVDAIDSVGSGLWPNFQTDYRPVVDFFKSNGDPVIATNVPRQYARQYARQVYREGFGALDKLSAAEKALLPPLPVPYDAELPGYQRMLEMMPAGHGGETFPMAQAIKDATMAHFIVAYAGGRKRFLHLNGSYHSDDFEGIGWYLQQYAPELKVVTITTVEQESIDELAEENTGKAHFTLAVPARMTKTY
ncbi:ChaN family lipoprotein [Lewinella sp. W8]|uniref:ChaN family lipoprotein n=1 Tax=Lewinella sp. W8 TaxID=2528208 RepID=UPI001068C17A|nr:ChaN family lipoprotein [Lewinella sp. W8]MTB53107.1 iron-regulated protein [Lewinella sp. W8]